MIKSVVPGYMTDAIYRVENVDRYDDRDIIDVNLIEAYERLMDFCLKHMDNRHVLEDDISIDARVSIVREVVGNILIHRDYTNAFPAKLIIDKDALYTENWNKYTKLYSHAEPILTEGDVFKIWIPLKRDANIIANGVNSGVNGVNHLDEDKDLLERLLTIVANDPKSTQAKLAEDLGVSKRTVQRLTDTLKEQGKLERIDGTRGYWKVKNG